MNEELREQADIVKKITVDEAKSLPNMLGAIASQMLEHVGFYTFTQNNKKVLLIRA